METWLTPLVPDHVVQPAEDRYKTHSLPALDQSEAALQDALYEADWDVFWVEL